MDLRIPGRPELLEARPITVRCPSCHHNGSFHGLLAHDVGWGRGVRDPAGQYASLDAMLIGMRQCPNEGCGSAIFFVKENKRLVTFPPEVIDFDATNLPNNILSSLEEAIRCHAAGCYRASALMIRRTLEELCDDKSAIGKNLKDRITGLNSVAVIPAQLLAAADELRILGNDAAHIEAKDYNKIGEEESDIAIELAKELLKAVYQYTSLVARLTALKKVNSP